MRRYSVMAILLVLLSIPKSFCFSQPIASSFDVEKAFAQIPTQAKTYRYQNSILKMPIGGHLQGIQSWVKDKRRFIVLSASSAHLAYLVKVELLPAGKLIAWQKLGESPFRHAGGCQIADSILAVGLEDNMGKKQSKIVVEDVTMNLTNAETQVAVHRRGAYKRATAGEVGFTKYRNGYLLAVADWDSQNIDFYFSDNSSPYHFDSLSTAALDKSCAYQNINLFVDSDGQLFLIGLGRTGKGNRADLFSVHLQENKVMVNHLSTRYFHCTHGASFRFAAGVVQQGNSFILLATQRRLHQKNVVNVFGNIPSE